MFKQIAFEHEPCQQIKPAAQYHLRTVRPGPRTLGRQVCLYEAIVSSKANSACGAVMWGL